jgi:hypothetical protein
MEGRDGMSEKISRRSYCLIAAWAAGILLLYAVFGLKGVRLLDRYRAEIEEARAAWIASPTMDPRTQEPAEPVTAGSKPADVRTGIEINRFDEFSLVESSWTVDFDIWFRWTGDTLNPGKSFNVVNGEILRRELKKQIVRGTERYEQYRVTARISKSFDPSRFPFNDEGLVIQIEDDDRGAGELRYVADTGIVDLPYLPTFRPVRVKTSLLLVKLHDYGRVSNADAPGAGVRMNSTLIFGMLVKPPGVSLYIRLFQALFASVAIAFIVFFIKPIHVDPRFGLSVGAFFAAVGNNIYVSSQMPQSDRVTLTAMVNLIGLVTIFLTIVQSAISLYMLDTMGRPRLSRFFDMVSFAALFIGYVAVNVILPFAARS